MYTRGQHIINLLTSSSITIVDLAICIMESELMNTGYKLCKKVRFPLKIGYCRELNLTPSLDDKQGSYYYNLIYILILSV